jgi:hypothetical protein
MESNRDLLKEAIADAKAVKETALAQAKVALEEAFTPFLKETLATRIAALDEVDDMEENMYMDDMEEGEYMEEGDEMEMEEGEKELDLEALLAELDEEKSDASKLEEEDLEELYEAEEGEEGEDEEFNIEDMSESDLTQFIEDVIQYIYPDDKEIERVGVRGIYLNNFIRWDSKIQHESMIKKFNYETKVQNRTFDTYNDVDCYNYSDVHDYIKFIKHGYGKVFDHATREIRLKRLTRDQGISLVKKYGFRQPQNLDLFLNWLGITENSFHYIINQHRNKQLWKLNDNWVWELTGDLFSDLIKSGDNCAALSVIDNNSEFILTQSYKSTDQNDDYILIGRGYN